MDTANIRRAGYPIRHSYFDFVQQFKVLDPHSPPISKVMQNKIASCCLGLNFSFNYY